MGSTSRPGIIAQLLAAQGSVPPDPFRELIVGQLGTDATATDGQVIQNVESLTDAEVKSLVGTKGDMLNRVLKARDKSKGRFSIWAIGLDPVAGTEAEVELAYSGTATEDRLMTVRPISSELFSFNIAVSKDDTANDVAVAVKAGLDALLTRFPAANAILTDTITLTANDSGSIPNKYSVVHENIPAGITVNTNESSSRDQFSSGATDPAVTGIFDNVESIRFHSILWPWENDFDEVDNFLAPRNVINNAFLQGVAFIGLDDTEANIKAKVNGGTPLNSQNLFFMGNRKVDGADAFVEPADWRVSEFCSIEGLRLTDGTPIAEFVTTTAPLDVVGGAGTSSLAYHMTPLADTKPVDPSLVFDNPEQSNLTADGFSIVGVNNTATAVVMGDVVSTYKLNTLGDPDISFKFLNYIRTGYLALEVYFRLLKSAYSQSRLTGGTLIAGRAIANESSIKAKYLSIYKLLSGAEYVLTQAGSDAEKYFFEQLNITADIATGLITSSGQLPIVTQIRDFNISFQLAFEIGG
jgi:phage tail sheath gpL-like